MSPDWYTVRFSHQITRRKYVHYIRDLGGRTVYVDRSAEAIWRWLHNERAERVIIDLGNLQLHVVIAHTTKS